MSTRALGSLLFNVPATDVMTFVVMSLAMIGVVCWRRTCRRVAQDARRLSRS